ncbi:GDP-mannose 4,6-dehydratase, partial [Listeria monocytogenes]|uniref:GDP-mannose 4,6-dehydratase n=3 Tax=Bacteria TaxID=2 RepID=UPI001A90F916
FEHGMPGRTYNVGGNTEKQNIEVVTTLCAILDEFQPRADGKLYAEQIAYVTDRPGHDKRYAINASRIRDELGWTPRETFDSGIRKTVKWYLDNRDWWETIVAEHQADHRRGLS